VSNESPPLPLGAPGTEEPRRYLLKLRYELIGCGLHGHELLATARSRPAMALIAAPSLVKLNRLATAPSPSMTQATWTSDAQSIPATMPSPITAPLSSAQKVRPMQALVLVAHCKALEARGPIASHSAGPPGPAALL
jgi:hypothetical protein